MKIYFYHWFEKDLNKYQFYLFPTICFDIDNSFDYDYYTLELSLFFWSLEIVMCRKRNNF